MTAIYVAGARVRLAPDMLIGTGGEAEVYDLGDGRALKLFKTPDHPDLAGAPIEQDAAKERLDIHQSKLRDFPGDLPERVIAPRALATDRKRGGRIVGYAMDLVPRGELLYRYGEPRVRRYSVSGDRVADALCDLRDTVAAIHDRGVVIGDFNDLNVLVEGGRAHVIDADSFQFGSYPCSVYSERFVDPLLCDPRANGLILKEHHRPSSDWYAFAVMVMRSLLCVGPYGGVYRPNDKSRRIAHGARPLRRITVFDPEVIYPKPALHYGLLPDDLLEYFKRTFVEDRRVPFPAPLLDDLRWTRCRACGGEHARASCPSCQGKRGKKPVFSRVRGRVTAEEVFTTGGAIVAVAPDAAGLCWVCREGGELKNRHGAVLERPNATHATRTPHVVCRDDGAFVIDSGRVSAIGLPSSAPVRIIDPCAGEPGGAACFASNQRRAYWLTGGRLWRDGDLGDVALGDVLRGQTRIWVGARFGFGFYRAGALTVGFVFDGEHPGIDDSIALPRIRGQVIAAECALADTRAWFSWTEARAGRELYRCALIARDGRCSKVIATAGTGGAAGTDTDTGSGDDWLRSLAGACAVGGYLFVPTDRGIQRIEAAGDRLRITRSFPDTEPFVDAASRLLVGEGGLYAVSQNRILRLQLS